MNMTILISLLAQSRTGAIIEIIILLLVAGLIAYLTAYYYYKPIYMARIHKLEVLYKSLEKTCSEKEQELVEVKGKLESKEKELEELRKKP